MKVEESSSPVAAVSGILSTDECSRMQVLQTPSMKWTPQDALCAKLFGPWNDLPCYDHMNEVALLRELDHIIVIFESRIHHSDVGFRAWRERHKRAMEAGFADIPGFPCLRIIRDDKHIWQDHVWEQRYHYLVFQRHQIVLERLARLLGVASRKAREGFFGELPAPPRATIKNRVRGPCSRRLALRCGWWRPLDALLDKAAESWGMDRREMKAQFWMEERSESKPCQAQQTQQMQQIHQSPTQHMQGMQQTYGYTVGEDCESGSHVAEKENLVPLEATMEAPTTLTSGDSILSY